MTCLRTAITAVMVLAIMSIGIQMMTSFEPPNAAQLLIGTSTRPGDLVSSPQPAPHRDDLR